MKIGVIGAGVMGTGVAQKFAQYDHEIVLLDINNEILKKATDSISRNLMIDNMFNKGKWDAKGILNRITITTDYSGLNECEAIVENVPEVMETKFKVYESLQKYVNENCFILVNTSCISITKIGSLMKNPDRVIGAHFMNPVPKQKFAEVIRGFYTSDETIDRTKKLLESANIDCTVVNDSPGFVSNRISHLMMNEAANIVMENIATPEQVDMVFTEGFHHETGPLHTADLIGLDTVLNSLEILYKSYEDPKFRCSPLLRKMVDAGLLGEKSGQGFFKYE